MGFQLTPGLLSDWAIFLTPSVENKGNTGMSDTTALAKYGQTDPNWAQERLDQLKKEKEERKSRAGFLKLPEGKTSIRVGPPWKAGLRSPIKEAWLHKIKDPADLKAPPRITIPCVLKNHGKPCRVCQKCRDLRNSGSKADKELAYQWGAQLRFFAQVVDIEHQDKGWLLWEFGTKLFEQYLKKTASEETGGDVTNPITGRNLIIDRTGTGQMDTTYDLSVSLKASKFPKPELLNELIDLDSLTSPWLNDRIEAALRGEDVRDNDGTETDSEGVQYLPPLTE
jgi:hypothetical protein